MKLPKYIENCIATLEVAGFEAYAVGGAVRDSLLGLEPSDFDVTTSATPDRVLELFAEKRTIPTGIKHGTVTVIFEENEKKHPVEITTFRVDGEYRDSRHPEAVVFASRISDDLSRRDFTVNAMAYNEKNGLIDPFGGTSDLEAGMIRAVGEPEKRFREDALRILRAFRFCSQLDFKLDEKTLGGALDCADLLKNISRERIGTELKKLLIGSGAAYSVGIMANENGAPVWDSLFAVPAPPAAAVSALSKVSAAHGYEARLSVLLSHLPIEERESVTASLRPSNEEKRRVLRFCRVHDFKIPTRDEDVAVFARRFIHLYNDILPAALELLSVWHGGESFDDFFRAVNCELSNKGSFSALAVSGGDIRSLCENDPASVGRILRELWDTVLCCPELNKKDILMTLAAELVARESLDGE